MRQARAGSRTIRSGSASATCSTTSLRPGRPATPRWPSRSNRMVGKPEDCRRQERNGNRRAAKEWKTPGREYGQGLHSRRAVLKLHRRAAGGAGAVSGKAMHATFALFEELMFRACVAYRCRQRTRRTSGENRPRRVLRSGPARRRPDAARASSPSGSAGPPRRSACTSFPGPYLVKAPQLHRHRRERRASPGDRVRCAGAACDVRRQAARPSAARLGQAAASCVELNEHGRNGQAHQAGQAQGGGRPEC